MTTSPQEPTEEPTAEPPQEPPDPQAQQGPLSPGAERLVVLALALTAFAMNLNASVMAALNPFLRDQYGWSPEQLGQLLGAAGLAGAVGALLLGPFVDRYGRRPSLLLGLLFFALASAGHGLTEDFEVLLVLRAIAGAAVGVGYSSASAVLADVVPYRRRGAAMGLFTAGLFLAIPVGLPAAVAFARTGSWQGVFWLQAGVGVVALATTFWAVPRATGQGAWVNPLGVLRQPQVVPSLLAVAAYVGVFTAMVQFSGQFLDDRALLPKAEQGPMWIALGLCSALGTVGLARFSDRVGKRNFVLATTMGATLCVVSLTRFLDGLTGFAIVGALLAVVTAARTGPFHALLTELVPREKRGTLMGLRGAVMQLGIGSCGLAAGLIYEGEGFRGLLYFCVAGMVISWGLVRAFVTERSVAA